MNRRTGRMLSRLARGAAILALAASAGLVGATASRADQADAKRLLKAMSDYLASQNAISFNYDSVLEIVTKDHQKLMLASSGNMDLNRPDKVRATRSGGFANVEMLFDGKTLTLLGKNLNVYGQVEIPGSLDHLVDQLRDKHRMALPGADLLSSNVYQILMRNVKDIKDLGSGVVGGTECDHLAFRAKDVDWQIWIAQGDVPYPCQYVITSKKVDQSPQYYVRVSDWKTGDQVAKDDFAFKNTSEAKKIDMKQLDGLHELPSQFAVGARK